MSAFRGNTSVIVKHVTEYDEYGQPAEPVCVRTKVQVIKFLDNTTETQLRQERSASHGRIDEDKAVVVLLFDPNFDIGADDLVEIFGTQLVVDGVWPRQNTLGKVVHQRVMLHRKIT